MNSNKNCMRIDRKHGHPRIVSVMVTFSRRRVTRMVKPMETALAGELSLDFCQHSGEKVGVFPVESEPMD